MPTAGVDSVAEQDLGDLILASVVSLVAFLWLLVLLAVTLGPRWVTSGYQSLEAAAAARARPAALSSNRP